MLGFELQLAGPLARAEQLEVEPVERRRRRRQPHQRPVGVQGVLDLVLERVPASQIDLPVAGPAFTHHSPRSKSKHN
jgi:hypothetical protein